MDTTTALIASRVEEARRDKGVARLPLSEATGIPLTTLRRKLDGHMPFTVTDLLMISRHLKCSFTPWLRDLPGAAA